MLRTPITVRATRAVRRIGQALSRDPITEEPLTRAAAKALLDHRNPSVLLPYVDFEDDIMVTDNGYHPCFGFGYQFAPVLVGGADLENQFEALISRAPDDTTLQFAAHSSAAIDDRINIWRHHRLEKNEIPILRELVNNRAEYMLNAANHYSLLEQERYHPREVRYYLFVNMTFTGDPTSKSQIDEFMRSLTEYKNSVEAYLEATGLGPAQLTKATTARLLRQLCNPQMTPTSLDECLGEIADAPHALREACFEKQTRIRMQGDKLLFTDDEREVAAVPITTDSYPDTLRLWQTGEIIGAVQSADRIANPYWLTTIIHKLGQEKATNKLEVALGLISRQTMYTAEWYKSLMSHVFERREHASLLLEETKSKHSLIRMMTACVVYTQPEHANTDSEIATAIWRKAGFRSSRETYIALPVWQTLMPWAYNPFLDEPNKGLQRSVLCHSLNGATAAICQGDWGGNGPVMKRMGGENIPYANGLLLTSRRGQASCLDIFEGQNNYNFAVVATSGAGKSFLANDIIVDILGRNGLVRVIDSGGSYRKICETLGGHELRFSATKPFSLNPFWGLTQNRVYTEQEEAMFRDKGAEFEVGTDIDEAFPMLKELVAQMAFPAQKAESFEMQLIESAIADGYEAGQDKMETRHVYEALLNNPHTEAQRIATQLRPYAIGRYARWFNGPPEVDLSSNFTVLELEDLVADKELTPVVLTLIMALTTRDMYLRPRSVTKLLLVDEAWRLLGGGESGAFIEEAFRTIRKYNGAAGVITQSFRDFEKSPAAQAAFDSCEWRFILQQSGSSLAYAQSNSLLGAGGDNQFLYDMLGTVRKGDGYSEVYVMSDSGSGLFRFMVDPLSYHLYTSNAQDNAMINNFAKEHGISEQEAIVELAKQAMARKH